jgi:hypothetical protein
MLRGSLQIDTKTLVCRERSAEHRTSAMFAIAQRTRSSGSAAKISLKIYPLRYGDFRRRGHFPMNLAVFLPRQFSKPRNPGLITPGSTSHGRLIIWSDLIGRCSGGGFDSRKCNRPGKKQVFGVPKLENSTTCSFCHHTIRCEVPP